MIKNILINLVTGEVKKVLDRNINIYLNHLKKSNNIVLKIELMIRREK
ncbi:MAG: hypothetical protein L6V81_06120 [Clostridium sp.]|nr:MAG: hypothetical protein L6V81_06120 [Clostridium sp.]